jgi:hypothetical protein
MDTSSSHLIFGLTLRLVAYSFPYNIFFWDCGVLHSFYMTKPWRGVFSFCRCYLFSNYNVIKTFIV